MTIHKILTSLIMTCAAIGGQAQSVLYPHHFDLHEVTLLEGPMKTAMELNFMNLVQYDTDRFLTPYIRQAGLSATTDSQSPYYQWEQRHPSFPNWAGNDLNLEGHSGGHYLSALALATAVCPKMLKNLEDRMDYMLQVMKDCQEQYDRDTTGMYGFIGGQPVNDDWRALFRGDIKPYQRHGGWVPLYCQHKILAGLRDAYIYGHRPLARELFRKLADWSANLIEKVSDRDLQRLLDIEHGGMNESLMDAYQLFGDEKYLLAAERYTHHVMLKGMQTADARFLDNRHANTQVPKYIGMARIGEQSGHGDYTTAAQHFWEDVVSNRTVCIGGNSVSEHFLSPKNVNRYIDHQDGPESCNTNNMLKLSEMLADQQPGDARYADFYEQAVWNHILSTQDPTTGGYVYFTTLRPQGYRIYSQPNEAMWCCVGTGMENHSKYGHFIYTHHGNKTLYVNLFTPSALKNADFIVTQQTRFPYEPSTTLTIGKAGNYTIALRHPAWVAKGYRITVNGQPVTMDVQQGVANYVTISRSWQVGDRIDVALPMTLRYEECPGLPDYIAFKYGPILLAAQTTASSEQQAQQTGLAYEHLQNEYAGSGRMDHAPSVKAQPKDLESAPLLIGTREKLLKNIKPVKGQALTFRIPVSSKGVKKYQRHMLTLQPFYTIHHARYMCYWHQLTAEAANALRQ